MLVGVWLDAQPHDAKRDAFLGGIAESLPRASGKSRRVLMSMVILVLMSTLAPISSADQEPTLIITSDTILTSDFVGHIVIDANDITLDCAGHTILGDSEGVGIWLEGRTGVTIENCHVTGFEIGFVLLSAADNTLRGNTAAVNGPAKSENQLGLGIIAGGFFMIHSQDNRLIRNTAVDNFDFGFLLRESHSNTVKANMADGLIRENDWGFALVLSDHNVMKENVARGNAAGFAVVGSTSNHLIENFAIDNSIGFQLEGAIENTFKENSASDNVYFLGEEFVSGYGFFISSRSHRNTFNENTVNDNAIAAFLLQESNDNWFRENTACGNPELVIFVDPPSSGNVFNENEIC